MAFSQAVEWYIELLICIFFSMIQKVSLRCVFYLKIAYILSNDYLLQNDNQFSTLTKKTAQNVS